MLEMLIAAFQTAQPLAGLSGLPISALFGLMGGAVGYGMVKGKVDATDRYIAAMEGRIDKRFDRVEKTLDDIQADMRSRP